MIEISINNTKHQLEEITSIEATLEQLGYQDKTMLGVALNQTFVPKDQWATVYLNQHDQLDILNPVSGG